MSTGSRNRFNANQPIPAMGVTLPDVFPSPIQGRFGRLDLHDIMEGRIPKVRNGQAVRQGWLRIAFGNGRDQDYTSPNISPSELQLRGRATLRTLEIDVDVEATTMIERVTTKLLAETLAPPSFNGRDFTFTDGSEGVLVAQTPAEPAIAFRGLASIKGEQARVAGIHFASDSLRGWIHIGEPPEPLDTAA